MQLQEPQSVAFFIMDKRRMDHIFLAIPMAMGPGPLEVFGHLLRLPLRLSITDRIKYYSFNLYRLWTLRRERSCKRLGTSQRLEVLFSDQGNIVRPHSISVNPPSALNTGACSHWRLGETGCSVLNHTRWAHCGGEILIDQAVLCPRALLYQD
jgi:hypothetical protein